MRSFKNGYLQDFKGFKKGIRGFFILHGSPKGLLIIQLRMVWRKIMKIQLTMFPPKNLRPLSPMPAGSIHPKIDHFPFETERQSFENSQKAIDIALRPFHHSMQPVSRSYPSKEIQPLLMLAPGIDIRLNSFLYPHTTQLGMKTKPALILKQNDPPSFALFGRAEFFLTRPEIPLSLPAKPARTGKSAASRNTPTGGSTGGHAVHGSLFDENASNTQSKPLRLIEPEESDILSETWTRPRPIPSSNDGQRGRSAHGEIDPGRPQPPPGCLYKSISPQSTESNRTIRQFAWISTQPKARDNLRSEFRSKLLEFHRPFVTRSLGSSLGARGLRLSWFSPDIALSGFVIT